MCRLLKVAKDELLVLQQFVEHSEMKFDKDPIPINQSVLSYANLDMSVNERKNDINKEYCGKRRRKRFLFEGLRDGEKPPVFER